MIAFEQLITELSSRTMKSYIKKAGKSKGKDRTKSISLAFTKLSSATERELWGDATTKMVYVSLPVRTTNNEEGDVPDKSKVINEVNKVLRKELGSKNFNMGYVRLVDYEYEATDEYHIYVKVNIRNDAPNEVKNNSIFR